MPTASPKPEPWLAAGDAEAAAELYAAIIAENPGDPAAVAGLAKLYISAGELENARTVLASVAAGGERDNAIIAAKAALELAEQAAAVGDASELVRKIAANPDDHQARFDFAILLNAQNRREEAAAELVEIIKRDRAWNDDGARKQLLQFFEAWGPADPATISARRKLAALLFLERGGNLPPSFRALSPRWGNHWCERRGRCAASDFWPPL